MAEDGVPLTSTNVVPLLADRLEREERQSLDAALEYERQVRELSDKQERELREAHERQVATATKTAFDAHESFHSQLSIAITQADERQKAALKIALEDHHREHEFHAAAHEREHRAHSREHELTELSLGKAELANEKRFEGVNEFREQLRDQAKNFVSVERVDAFQKEFDRRISESNSNAQGFYEANRLRIENLEKGDVKSEGKGAGQAVMIAAIVTIVTIASALLGMLVLIVNLSK